MSLWVLHNLRQLSIYTLTQALNFAFNNFPLVGKWHFYMREMKICIPIFPRAPHQKLRGPKQWETFRRSFFTEVRMLRTKRTILSMRAHAQSLKKGPLYLLSPAPQKVSYCCMCSGLIQGLLTSWPNIAAATCDVGARGHQYKSRVPWLKCKRLISESDLFSLWSNRNSKTELERGVLGEKPWWSKPQGTFCQHCSNWSITSLYWTLYTV